jgi:GNAT superfamily N-acetyltransferase
MNPVTIRPATLADRPALRVLHERSLRGLGRGHLSPAAIEAMLRGEDFADERLIAGGTYFVAFMGNRLVASGGWSMEAPRFARTIGAVAVQGDPVPTVRAMFVDPVCARHGLGRRMLEHVEASIAAAGWRRAVLIASPMGLGFYARQGWRPLAEIALQVGAHAIPSTEMDKIVLPSARALPPATNSGARAA